MYGEIDNKGTVGGDEFALTGDQARALASLQSFVCSQSEKCFILEGYAGSGKTFLIRRFVQWLASENMGFLLAAPTGRAGKVLANKTGYPAGTLHRAIYAMDKLLVRKDGKDGFKFYYGLKLVAQDDRPRVIVVDEASMVSDRADDEKFFGFGSGRLLQDLMAFAAARDDWSGCQIVFVGDPAQLPPVGMEASPALDEAYLKNEYGVGVCKESLRQVVRQAADSAILKAAGRIRDDIEAGRQNRLAIAPDGQEIHELQPSQVCDLWEQELSRTRVPSVSPPMVCVTYSNRMALSYNASVRARIHPDGDGFHPVRPGDYLMVVANNRPTGLWNGELALVLGAASTIEERTVRCHFQDGVASVRLVFRLVQMAVPDESHPKEEPRIVVCNVLENVLYGKTRDVLEEEQIALFVDFKNRHPKLRPGSEEFAMALAADPYFHAVRAKFGYAVTCHKAQGGEWPTAIVIFESGGTHTQMLRWAYTAITRAKTNLYGVGFPKSSMKNWKTDPVALADLEPRMEIPVAKVGGEDSPESVSVSVIEKGCRVAVPSDLDWMAPLHGAAVEAWKQEGIEVEAMEPFSDKWFVRYRLAKGGHVVRLQLAFNRAMETKLTDVRMLTQPEPDGLLNTCREAFVRAKVVARSVSDANSAVPPELREWREEVVAPAVDRLGGDILRVEHLAWRERYEVCSSANKLVVLDFCYDKRMRINHRPEILTGTLDVDFAKRIIEEIEA